MRFRIKLRRRLLAEASREQPVRTLRLALRRRRRLAFPAAGCGRRCGRRRRRRPRAHAAGVARFVRGGAGRRACLLLSLLVLLVGTGSTVSEGRDFGVKDLSDTLESKVGSSSVFLFVFGLFAASFSSALTIALGAAFTCQSLLSTTATTIEASRPRRRCATQWTRGARWRWPSYAVWPRYCRLWSSAWRDGECPNSKVESRRTAGSR